MAQGLLRFPEHPPEATGRSARPIKGGFDGVEYGSDCVEIHLLQLECGLPQCKQGLFGKPALVRQRATSEPVAKRKLRPFLEHRDSDETEACGKAVDPSRGPLGIA